MVNNTFKGILGMQFITSGILISVDIFQLATQKMDLKIVYTILYFIALSIELISYCFPASEVMHKVKF